MNPRRDTDCGVSSDIFISSIAGSPRRVVNRPVERDLVPHTIILFGCPVQRSSAPFLSTADRMSPNVTTREPIWPIIFDLTSDQGRTGVRVGSDPIPTLVRPQPSSSSTPDICL